MRINFIDYTMKVEFLNENGCPDLEAGTWKHMEGGFYDSFISILDQIKDPDTKVKLLDINDLDRGVKNWQQFGNILKEKFPNLKGLVFEMNYYYNSKEDDPWKTAETFFVQMELDYLEIKWAQQFKGYVTNAESTDSYTVNLYIDEQQFDDPDEFDSIREELANEARENGSNYNIYIDQSDEYIPETDKCELCGKDEDLNMCKECQGRYLLKIPHRNLTTCVHGHICEECPNHATWRYNRDSNYNCGGSSDHCPVCKHDIPYMEFLAYLQTNIRYKDLLKKYMSEGDANECWYCWPCL